MSIRYNSPVILTFAFVCICAMFAHDYTGGRSTDLLFKNYPGFRWKEPLFYLRLFSHVFGHASWQHLISNFSLILLIGPLLEEKYGGKYLLKMMCITALLTGFINCIFFKTALMGASGIVFMMILLSSFANFKKGEIPLTFILIAVLYIGNEVMMAFQKDNISQFAHILGGVCGAISGFGLIKR